MATIKLTEKEIAALLYALNVTEELYTEELDSTYVSLDAVRAKLEK